MLVNIHKYDAAMRLRPETKNLIRNRITEGAAILFRKNGYDAVNIDQVMEAAGLTRGAFYAHFKNKAELFSEVSRHHHPILRMLRERDGATADDLRDQMRQIFSDYLNPNHLDEIFAGCTFASLTGEISRAQSIVKQGYGAALEEIQSEMMRGQSDGADASLMRSAALLAFGAIPAAMACEDAQERAAVLTAAHTGFETLIHAALAPIHS